MFVGPLCIYPNSLYGYQPLSRFTTPLVNNSTSQINYNRSRVMTPLSSEDNNSSICLNPSGNWHTSISFTSALSSSYLTSLSTMLSPVSCVLTDSNSVASGMGSVTSTLSSNLGSTQLGGMISNSIGIFNLIPDGPLTLSPFLSQTLSGTDYYHQQQLQINQLNCSKSNLPTSCLMVSSNSQISSLLSSSLLPSSVATIMASSSKGLYANSRFNEGSTGPAYDLQSIQTSEAVIAAAVNAGLVMTDGQSTPNLMPNVISDIPFICANRSQTPVTGIAIDNLGSTGGGFYALTTPSSTTSVSNSLNYRVVVLVRYYYYY